MTTHRQDLDGAVLWTASANGLTVQHLSTDAASTLTERCVVEGGNVVLALVDEHGERLAYAFRRA